MSTSFKNIAKSIFFKTNRYIPFLDHSTYSGIIRYRAGLPLTSICELAKPISLLSSFTYENHVSNDFYGHATVLKKFCGLPDTYSLKFSIEHGVSFTKNITNLDIQSPFEAIMCSGKTRSEILRKYKPYTYSVGPFINFVSGLLSASKIKTEKRRIGSNLLVFPFHSTGDVNTTFDVEELCKKIKTIGSKYDNVRICMYWKDILNGSHKPYEKYGFECVTAGHILDNNFLPRLRSIIETSTMTMSNCPGTHIGYCLFLGKPHFIVKQDLKITGRKSEVLLVKKEIGDDSDALIRKTFDSSKPIITKTQMKLVNYYWGFDQTKSKNELLKIIDETEKIYQNRHKE